MRVEADITKDDFIEFLAHAVGQSMPLRRSLVAFGVTGMCVLVGGGLLFAAILGDESWFAVILIGLTLPSYLIWHRWYWRRYPQRTAKNLLARGYGRTVLGKHTVEISEDGVRHSGAFGDSQIRWAAIEKIEESAHAAYLYVGQSAAIIIPRSPFSDEESYERFVDTARAYRDAAPSFQASCPDCGYDLSGLSAGGCPECGWKREVAPEQSPPSPS